MEMEFKGLFKPNPRGFGFVNTDTHGIYVHPRIAKRFFYFDILTLTYCHIIQFYVQ